MDHGDIISCISLGISGVGVSFTTGSPRYPFFWHSFPGSIKITLQSEISVVIVFVANQGLMKALEEIFQPYGGIESVILKQIGSADITLTEHNDRMTNTRYQAMLMGMRSARMYGATQPVGLGLDVAGG